MAETMAAGGFNYEKIAGEAVQKMDGQMCWPADWIREELPMENKEGNCLHGTVQTLLKQSIGCPKYYDAFYAGPDESQAVLPQWPAAPKETVLVFVDKVGITQGIISALPEGRTGTKKIVEGMEDLSQADIEDLIGPKGWDMIVFGVGLDAPASPSVADVIDQNTVLTKCFFNLCKAINKKGGAPATKKLAVITRGNFEEDPKVHKKFGLAMTTSGTLFGMCNTVRQELEEVDIQYIDTEYAPEKIEDLCPIIASELVRCGTFGHNSVLINRKGRYVHRSVSSAEYEQAKREWVMPSSGTIAILGGNGALGLVMGGWLLDKAKEQGVSGFRIQFLSRSMKITDQNMPAWKKIEEQAAAIGVEVEQAKADISSQEAVDDFISGLRGELVGLIHSAGVLQDSMLMNMTWEKCETVFDSKHRPALYIHGALERFQNPGLKFLWNFSSTSVYGNMGQFNYSGSNSFLDSLTRHRVARGKPSAAMQWGAWGEVGMAANLDQASKARMNAGPIPPHTNQEGIRGLEAGIRSNMPYFAVYKVNAPMFIGMIQPADNGFQNYLRNFHSEVAPTNLPPSIEPKHYYTSVRMAFGGNYTAEGRERLCFQRHVAPMAEAYEKEWGDDFRQW